MSKTTPPKWAVRFFKWYCNDHLAEAVLGDMIELYERRISSLGKRRANLLFVWNVISFLRPFAVRKKSIIHTNHIAMFRSNIKIAWRAMLRQKMYAAIKVGGFALGLATCIIIAVFIRHEISYDKHYKDGARIYRMYNEMKGERSERWTSFPAPAASIFKHDFPEIEKAGRLIPYEWFDAGDNLVRRDDQTENTFEVGFAYADQELLEILEIPMVYGQLEHALDQPNTIVISRKVSEKYFPNEDPTGKIFILNENKAKPLTIGGVMENFPTNSHLQYDFFLTLTNEEFWPGEQASWCCWNYNVYVKLKPGTDLAALEKKLLKVRDAHYVSFLEKEGSQAVSEVKENHFFSLQPVSDIYLNSLNLDDMGSRSDIRYIWLFGSIAFFILLLACINFINLSTAKSANRAKEVGLRKVVGSFRGYLVRQFLMESLLYSFISFVIAVALVILALPYFNVLAGKTIDVPWNEWWTIPLLVLAAIIVGIIAGIYPSFYLSSFKPIEVLKGSVRLGAKSSALRSSMVVFQFTTSIILIIGTFVVNRQMNYILNTKVGFDKDQVVMIQGANTLDKQLQTFKDELLQLAQVKNATITDYLPVSGTKRDQNGFWLEGKQKIDKAVGAQRWNVDEDYLETMGMKLIEGRNFNHEIASDSQAVIINQSMAKALGLKKPLGAIIENWEKFHVIGVVEDFHFESMKGKIGPLCMTMGWWGSIISVKVKGGDMKENLASITAVWNKFMPNQPFRYTFLDDRYSQMYDDVQRIGNIFATFAVLAIIVACLGLFALSAFMAEQRTKEISIRLVLGASINGIFRLLTQNFLKLIVVSFVIATPVAWFMMNRWLEDYAYHTDLTWDVFLISGVISLMVALLTVSYQSLRAAFANPATSLRSE